MSVLLAVLLGSWTSLLVVSTLHFVTVHHLKVYSHSPVSYAGCDRCELLFAVCEYEVQYYIEGFYRDINYFYKYDSPCNTENFYCKNAYKEGILAKNVEQIQCCVPWHFMSFEINSILTGEQIWNKGFLIKGEVRMNNYVFQEEALDGIGMNLETSPWNSWWWLSEEFCLSKSSAHAGTEFLLLKQYILTVVEKLPRGMLHYFSEAVCSA